MLDLKIILAGCLTDASSIKLCAVRQPCRVRVFKSYHLFGSYVLGLYVLSGSQEGISSGRGNTFSIALMRPRFPIIQLV